jgi:hypothetical protein
MTTGGDMKDGIEIGIETGTMTVRDVNRIDMFIQMSAGREVLATANDMTDHRVARGLGRLRAAVGPETKTASIMNDLQSAPGGVASVGVDRQSIVPRHHAIQCGQRMKTRATLPSVLNLLRADEEDSRRAWARSTRASQRIMIPNAISLSMMSHLRREKAMIGRLRWPPFERVQTGVAAAAAKLLRERKSPRTTEWMSATCVGGRRASRGSGITERLRMEIPLMCDLRGREESPR